MQIPAATQQKITREEAQEIRDYYDNGHQADFVTDALHATPWRLQSEIISAVFKYPKVAVKSCNASGKSYIAARIALTFLTLKPGSIVITTAPTWRQVKDVLWREMRTAIALSPIKLTDKQATQVGLDISDDWFAVGLSTKDAEKFFGYHADDILVIVDEASGVEEEIYVGVDAVTPNLNAHVLMIGNPTNPEGRFFKAFNDPLVKKFSISAFDTPNFTANNINNLDDLLRVFTPPLGIEPLEHLVEVQKTLKVPYPALINPSKVYERYLQWGPEHPMWEALIMAEFPSQASTALIPLGLILKSVEVWKQMEAAKKDPEYKLKPEWAITIEEVHEYGLDVARYGDDKNVLYPRLGGFVLKCSEWSKVDTAITTDRTIDALSLEDWLAVIKVDDTGVGGAVTDQLIRKKQEHPDQYHYSVVPINFGAGTTNPLKYFNLRAEMFDNLAQQFKDHKIAIPEDEDLIYELAAIRVMYVGKEANIIQIESKQKLKDRLKRSPDKADALALAFAKSHIGKWPTREELEGQSEHRVYNQDVNLEPITPRMDTRY